MKKALAFCALIWSGQLYAQSCPPGYYVTGSAEAGWYNCVPMQDTEQAPPTSSAWRTNWIAIAMGGGGFGVGKDQPSKRKAEKIAMSECRKTAAADKCSISIVTYNQCVAASAGKSIASTFRAPTKEEAEKGANGRCSASAANAGSSCSVFYSGCSYPERVR